VAIQAKSVFLRIKEFVMCFAENAGAIPCNMILLKLKQISWRYKMSSKKDAWFNFYSEEDIRKLLKHNAKVHSREVILLGLIALLLAVLEGYRSLTCGLA